MNEPSPSVIGYVGRLKEQHIFNEEVVQRVRYRCYLKPSLQHSSIKSVRKRLTFGNIILEIQKIQGITVKFWMRLTHYLGRGLEEAASMATLIEILLWDETSDDG
ncbi:MAG: hypothetical protein FJ344_01595 [Sphingomonadales bacterium]|nr:hypothetical protein [Sphingomonadales bacterium]